MRPAYRGAQLRSKMNALAAQEAAFSAPVYDRLGRAFVESAKTVGNAEWVPLDVDVELSAALFEVHGEAGGRRVSRASVVGSLGGPLMGRFAKSALSVYGRSPSRLLGLIPRGWSFIYRDCGFVTVRTRPESGDSRITFVDVPDVFFGPGYIEGVAGGFEAIFHFAEIPGTMAIGELRPERQRLELLASWQTGDDDAHSPEEHA